MNNLASAPSIQRTLLVVDDQRAVCITLNYLLGTAGYRVVTAESGRMALRLLENELIDGALIDVHMPVMNGLETCIALQSRADAIGRPFRVWFMTGAPTAELRRQCAEIGGLGLLHKPFDPDVLLAQLEAGLSAPLSLWSSAPGAPCVIGDDVERDGVS